MWETWMFALTSFWSSARILLCESHNQLSAINVSRRYDIFSRKLPDCGLIFLKKSFWTWKDWRILNISRGPSIKAITGLPLSIWQASFASNFRSAISLQSNHTFIDFIVGPGFPAPDELMRFPSQWMEFRHCGCENKPLRWISPKYTASWRFGLIWDPSAARTVISWLAVVSTE